jgi:hypothetical protein
LLTWHHFDPPWRERQHHDPAGMIALCSNCHGEADLLTKEQLHKIKDEGRERAATIAHRFAWRRRKLLVVLGGNFFYNCDLILRVSSRRCVWFNRTETGEFELNFRLPASSGRPPFTVMGNVWMTLSDADDIIAPPKW